MNRYEKAADYHHRGFNCCQSVLAAFADLTGLPEQTCFDAVGGFGRGLQAEEVCGVVTGAAVVLPGSPVFLRGC